MEPGEDGSVEEDVGQSVRVEYTQDECPGKIQDEGLNEPQYKALAENQDTDSSEDPSKYLGTTKADDQVGEGPERVRQDEDEAGEASEASEAVKMTEITDSQPVPTLLMTCWFGDVSW